MLASMVSKRMVIAYFSVQVCCFICSTRIYLLDSQKNSELQARLETGTLHLLGAFCSYMCG